MLDVIVLEFILVFLDFLTGSNNKLIETLDYSTKMFLMFPNWINLITQYFSLSSEPET